MSPTSNNARPAYAELDSKLRYKANFRLDAPLSLTRLILSQKLAHAAATSQTPLKPLCDAMQSLQLRPHDGEILYT